ncbi:calcium-binding protein [Acidisphaera sp. L21]|uniref:calcium-binding protein n=1 Tax=Acidisphaera sp. L21 TaxID=1641851 RepID=UPI00131D0E08|nr:calcium-binding protein [Acidisphaera sp. L21]
MRAWFYVVIACVAWLAETSGARAKPHAATPADTFLDTLGVNTHLVYKDGAYANPALVVQDLRYLGIHHVRDELVSHLGPDTASFSDYATLADAGMKFDLVINRGAPSNSGKPFVEVAMLTLDMLQKVIPRSIASIEGPNEINNWPIDAYKNLTGIPAALQSQKDIYDSVRANPKLKGVSVFDLTGAPKQAGFAGRADYGNQHPYPHNGMQPAEWISRGFDGAYALSGDFPRVITETGNFSLPSTWPIGKPWWEASVMLGVDEETQAKSILNSYFQAYADGVHRTYVYELLDDKADPANTDSSQHYGLFHADHTPKPIATALHILTAILQGGSLAAPKNDQLDFEVLGMPTTANAVLFQKSPRVFIVALWNNVPFWTWNTQASHEIQSPLARVTLKLGQEVKSVEVIDPLIEAMPVQRSGAVRTMPLSVGDHPLLVVVTLP